MPKESCSRPRGFRLDSISFIAIISRTSARLELRSVFFVILNIAAAIVT